MKRTLLQAALAAGLFLTAGEALAVKSQNSIAGTGGQASSRQPILREEVLAAANEVCQAWNTERMGSLLDASFPGRDVFLSSYSKAPKDARLVLISLQGFTEVGDRVTATISVAVELTVNGALTRLPSRNVTWTFKRYD